jgi:hypothetical protein
LLSFNRDKAFSNVVDGLVFLDLTRTSAPGLWGLKGIANFAPFTAWRLTSIHDSGKPVRIHPQTFFGPNPHAPRVSFYPSP